MGFFKIILILGNYSEVNKKSTLDVFIYLRFKVYEPQIRSILSKINSLPSNHKIKPPIERKGAKGITCPYLIRFMDNPTRQKIAAII